MSATETDVLAIVRESPIKVLEQDRAGWIALFGPGFVVEDPVGSRPVRDSEEDLGHFWDAFIANNSIVFTVYQDWIDGGDVFRNVLITTTMPSGAAVTTPAHLLYETTTEGGSLQLRRMAAHWEPLPVYRQLALPTPRNLRSGLAMGRRMLSNLGPSGTAKFVGAARSPAKSAKPLVRERAAEQGITLDHIIASGTYITGVGQRSGEPVAVLATITDGAVTDLRVFARTIA